MYNANVADYPPPQLSLSPRPRGLACQRRLHALLLELDDRHLPAVQVYRNSTAVVTLSHAIHPPALIHNPVRPSAPLPPLPFAVAASGSAPPCTCCSQKVAVLNQQHPYTARGWPLAIPIQYSTVCVCVHLLRHTLIYSMNSALG